MTEISISFIQFLIVGIPQGFLCVLAVFIFTGTKLSIKNYLIMSAIFTAITYLVRFLPISLGVNSMLALSSLTLSFLIIYKPDLKNIIRLIVSIIVIFMLVGISEILAEISLILIFGKVRMLELLNSSSDLVRSIAMIPTDIIFGILIFISYMVLKKKAKQESYGEISEKAGQ